MLLAPLALACASFTNERSTADVSARSFAIHATKALIASLDGVQAIDDARLVVRDGRIVAIGPASSTPCPTDVTELDVRPNWIMPGLVDLHSHIAGPGGDINDMVLQINAGLRVTPAVRPGNNELQRAVESGVTTILFIPGSGTNMSGSGVLLKTALPTYEEMRVRDPGSLKIAQGDNPTRWGYGMGRGLMNWHIRGELTRGLAYAKRMQASEDAEAHGSGAERDEQRTDAQRLDAQGTTARTSDAHERDAGQLRGAHRERTDLARDIRFDVFRDLLAKRTQVSTHTQIYALVLYTLEIIRKEAGVDVYIDHGEWKGYLATEQALALGVPAVCGPREIDAAGGRAMDFDGRIIGIAAEYQARGMKDVGFNTDAPVVPEEELFLQATMGVRYGFDEREMQSVRGLTIFPAHVAGIDARVGSLEVGKDADVVVISGNPLDPRSQVQRVFIEGRSVYELARSERASSSARWR